MRLVYLFLLMVLMTVSSFSQTRKVFADSVLVNKAGTYTTIQNFLESVAGDIDSLHVNGDDIYAIAPDGDTLQYGTISSAAVDGNTITRNASTGKIGVTQVDSIKSDRDIIEFYNGGEKQISLAVISDTLNLKAYSAYDGDMVYVQKVYSSGEGAGVFVHTTSAHPTGVVSFDAPEVGGQWTRLPYHLGSNIHSSWANVIGDDATDNLAAGNKLIATARTARRDIEFPKGTFRFSDSLLVNSIGTHIAVPAFRGAGYGHTILKWTGTSSGIVFYKDTQLAVYQPIVEHMTLQGNGMATSAGAGVFSDTSSLGRLNGLRVEDFKYGIRLWQSNSMLLTSNYVTENKHGIWFEKQCNETTLLNSYPVFNDSIQYYQNAGNRINIIGGSISGQAGSTGDYAVWLTGAGKLNLWGVSFEGTDSSVFKVDGSSTINIDASNVAYNATTSHRFMEISGGAKARITGSTVHSSVPAGTASIIQSGSTTRVYGDNTTHLRTVWDDTRTYYPKEWESIPGSGGISADSTNRGRLIWKLKQAGINDQLFLTVLRKDNTYNNIGILDNADIMFSTDSSTQPTQNSNYAIRIIGDVFTTSGGDCTIVASAVLDTNGWTEIRPIVTINHNNPASTGDNFGFTGTIVDDDGAAGTGTVKIRINHPGYTATTNHQYTIIAYIKPSGWVK